jgi:hypothetical protein
MTVKLRRLGSLGLGLMMLAFTVESAMAEDDIEFGFSADYFTKYIWRGQNLTDGSVFQPGFSVGYKGFTASIWGNLEMTSVNDNSGEFTELDYTLDYTGAVPGIEGLSYSVGMIYYDFPNTAFEATTEIYWGFSLDAPFNPSITVYHDVDEVDGTYVSLGFGHSIEKIFELGPDLPVGMELGASLGWGSSAYNEAYWGVSGGKMQDLALSVSFPVDIGGWSLSPSLNYVTLLSDSIRDTGADSDMFFAGVSLSKSF